MITEDVLLLGPARLVEVPHDDGPVGGGRGNQLLVDGRPHDVVAAKVEVDVLSHPEVGPLDKLLLLDAVYFEHRPTSNYDLKI